MTTAPIVTITDELLAEIEAAANAATPQALDSAEEIIKADPGAMIECPVCGGEGYASIENDYCNFDNHAIGVQFYWYRSRVRRSGALLPPRQPRHHQSPSGPHRRPQATARRGWRDCRKLRALQEGC